MDKLRASYLDKADFISIYIAEAHAADEWTLRDKFNAELGGKWDVLVARSLEQRMATAKEWVQWLGTDCPYFVDLMDDNARLAYGAWPERLAILEDGQLVYYGAQGPWGYVPEEVGAWLAKRFPAGADAAATSNKNASVGLASKL